MQVKQWEYKRVWVPDEKMFDETSTLEAGFNELGRQGWELAKLIPTNKFKVNNSQMLRSGFIALFKHRIQ